MLPASKNQRGGLRQNLQINLGRASIATISDD